MNFQQLENGSITIDIREDLMKVIGDFSEEVHGNVSSPAGHSHFVANKKAGKLNST